MPGSMQRWAISQPHLSAVLIRIPKTYLRDPLLTLEPCSDARCQRPLREALVGPSASKSDASAGRKQIPMLLAAQVLNIRKVLQS